MRQLDMVWCQVERKGRFYNAYKVITLRCHFAVTVRKAERKWEY